MQPATRRVLVDLRLSLWSKVHTTGNESSAARSEVAPVAPSTSRNVTETAAISTTAMGCYKIYKINSEESQGYQDLEQ